MNVSERVYLNRNFYSCSEVLCQNLGPTELGIVLAPLGMRGTDDLLCEFLLIFLEFFHISDFNNILCIMFPAE